jgi:hypothetical protein
MGMGGSFSEVVKRPGGEYECSYKLAPPPPYAVMACTRKNYLYLSSHCILYLDEKYNLINIRIISIYAVVGALFRGAYLLTPPSALTAAHGIIRYLLVSQGITTILPPFVLKFSFSSSSYFNISNSF